jgi:hypothetical protein
MKYIDYACAWAMLLTAVVFLAVIEIRRPPGAVFDTPMFWIPVAMINLIRLRNGYAVVKGLRTFCISANLMVLSLEILRLGESTGTFRNWGWLYLLPNPLRLVQYLVYALISWWKWSPYPIVAIAAFGETLFSVLQKDASRETARV